MSDPLIEPDLPPSRALLTVAAGLESLLDGVGRVLLVAAAVVIVGEFAVVALRYGWSFSRPWLQESVLAANAALFLLGAAYTLRHDQHVRVDLWSRRWSARGQAWAEITGFAVFLLPFSTLIVWVGWPYFLRSWGMAEGSNQPGGLPALYLIKALIPAAGLLLIMAGSARALRAVAVLTERTEADQQ